MEFSFHVDIPRGMHLRARLSFGGRWTHSCVPQTAAPRAPPPTNAATVGAKSKVEESPSIGIVGIIYWLVNDTPIPSYHRQINYIYQYGEFVWGPFEPLFLRRRRPEFLDGRRQIFAGGEPRSRSVTHVAMIMMSLLIRRELTLPVRYLIEIVAAEFSGLARRVGRESFSRSDLCTD